MRTSDEASAQLVGLVSAMAIFLVASATLADFSLRPPGASTAKFADVGLQGKVSSALGVLVGTPGFPADWGTSASSVDSLARFGLLEPGSASTLDRAKFLAFARGKFLGGSSTNGFVDYAEARDGMGLTGSDFHVRTAPAFDAKDGTYGLVGLSSYRVAYVGSAAHAATATAERAALDALDVGFANPGDAFTDDATSLRATLLPKLGAHATQSVLNPGQRVVDFQRAPATAYASRLPLEASPTTALSLADYSEGREIRATLPPLDLSAVATRATITWRESVDAARDPNDHGWIEASADGGATWSRLTDSPAAWSRDLGVETMLLPRTATIDATTCAACLRAPSVLLALHWTADVNGLHGKGWIVDDLRAVGDAGETLASDTFEDKAYDALVLGSDLDQATLSRADVAGAIADFVTKEDGRVLALGSSSPTTAWLAKIDRAAVRDAHAVVGNPDTTHPLLNVPNPLRWTTYATGGRAWDLTGTPEKALYAGILDDGTKDRDLLAVSSLGAFGSDDASVLLTAFQPGTFAPDEAQRFFANALLYGRYHGLYAELGPAVPTAAPVASATRTALVDRTGHGDRTPLSLTMFVWDGRASTTAPPFAATPSAPRDLAAVGLGPVSLSWTAPLTNGSAPISAYRVYRGSMPGAGSLLATIGTNVTYVDAAAAQGVTYVYNVTAVNAVGASASSPDAQASASGFPGAPRSPAAVGAIGKMALAWLPPSSDGGSSITGYRIYRATASGQESPLATIGANLTFLDANLPNGATRYYQFSAMNAAGEGPRSTEAVGSTWSAPSAPALPPVVTPGLGQVVVAWTPPATNGAPLTSILVYGGDVGSPPTLLATLPPNATSWTNAGLAPGETRFYDVAGVNVLGAGANSTAATATTFAPPSAPGAPNVTGGVANITLSWSPPSSNGGTPVTGYQIYGGPNASTQTLIATIGANATFVDSGLPPATTVTFTVVAVNAAGGSTRSNVSAGSTFALPGAPIASAVGGLGLHTISWTAPISNGGSPITGYKIYAGNASGGETLLATTGTNLSFVNAGLGFLQTRYYKVAAITAVGQGPFSNEVNATSLGLATAPTLVATGGDRVINLTWTTPISNGGSPITGYRIFRSNASGNETLLATIGTNLSYSDAGLPNNTTRYYKVAAVTIAGQGASSNEAFARTNLRACFTINTNGGIQILTDCNATFTIVGSQITYGAGGPVVDVTASYTRNGGQTFTQLFGNTAVVAGEIAYFSVTAGSVVGVHGDAHYGTFHAAYDSFRGDPHVDVLRNGSAPPAVNAFGNQTSLAVFLQPYLVNGAIRLLPNQAIVLFEFNQQLNVAAADYQDMVVLLSFD